MTAAPASGSAGGPDAARIPSQGRRRRRGWLRVGTVVAVVGLVATGLLAWVTDVVGQHTEQHLLQLQSREAGDILGEVVPAIRTPLITVAAGTDVSGGSVSEVQPYVGPLVGTGPGHLFRSLSVWAVTAQGAAPPRQLLAVGGARSVSESSLLRLVPGVTYSTLQVVDLLHATPPALGFSVASLGSSPRYVVYAETAVPAGRRVKAPSTPAFNHIAFALYLGRHPTPAGLIESTTGAAMSGQTASTVIPFGTSALDFVASPTAPLEGGLLAALPWIIAAVGVVLTAAGVILAERLTRRRRLAERLARENHRLFAEQRSIAQSLQTALLPSDLPVIDGIRVDVRYLPGDPGADIGGDWYDVIRCDDTSFLFVVGDVSGRGVVAAKSMAALHFAIRAYAAQGDDPAVILGKLGALLDVHRDGHFATVLLGHVDVPAHRLTLVNAGHLPPLVVSEQGAEYASVAVGTPIGVTTGYGYHPQTVDVPGDGSVLAYTDGLVERRGEILDEGLARLRAVAAADGHEASLLDRVVTELVPEQGADDVALLELRWTS